MGSIPVMPPARGVDVSGIDLPGIGSLAGDDAGRVRLPELVGWLAGLDPARLPSGFEVLELVAAWQLVSNAAAAATMEAVAELASRPEMTPTAAQASRSPGPAGSWLGDQVAARLGDGCAAAAHRCAVAVDLPSRFPATFAQFRAGRITEYKAHLVADGCTALSDQHARIVDAAVADHAAGQPPARLRAAVRRHLLRADPATAAERRTRAENDRCVRISPVDDGMATLWALLPAVAATRIGTALDTAARAARAAGDPRTLDQLAADLLTDRATGTQPDTASAGQAGAGSGAQVHVVVPAATLLGLADHPGQLTGYGPIDPDLARTLARDTTWRRILTDPADHTLLAVSPDTYRPGAVLARHIHTRDQTCRYPTCDRPAIHTELDHTIPYSRGGPTLPGNLGPLCRRHHTYKTQADTGPPRLRQPRPGHFSWTTPTGHNYHVHPPPLHQPDDPLLPRRPLSPTEAALVRQLVSKAGPTEFDPTRQRGCQTHPTDAVGRGDAMSRVVHFEIQADDIERAKAFYAAAFDWSFEDYGQFTGTPYWGVLTGPDDEPGINGGLMQRPAPASAGQGANAFVCTMEVGDYDQTERRILDAGGLVAMPKMALTGMAWQGYYLDTEGNVFGIHQPDPEAA